jgi:hypothetical protein
VPCIFGFGCISYSVFCGGASLHCVGCWIWGEIDNLSFWWCIYYCSFDCDSLYGIINIHHLTLLFFSQNPNLALKMTLVGGNLEHAFPESIAQSAMFRLYLWLNR